MYNTLIVVDQQSAEALSGIANVIRFDQYLTDYPKLNEPKMRIVNFCDTEKYLSVGYYCSLLAEARQHNVVPSVKTINDMRNGVEIPINTQWLTKREIRKLETLSEQENILVCLGKSNHAEFQTMASKLFHQYPVPVLNVKYLPETKRLFLQSIALHSLSDQQRDFIMAELIDRRGYWQRSRPNKSYRWEMAILVNTDEKTPPSNKGALTRFVKSAAKMGIRAELVSAENLLDMNQYDALFIRETTAIDHHTYSLACEAENKGVVVIDDPSSILRCCNKVFLHDAFKYQNVPSPHTEIIDSTDVSDLENLESRLTYPMILKMPESSFSRGVFKVKNRQELKDKLTILLDESALALVQEYLFTEFDWRIGVLNGRAIYACRYYMAPGHWQIYNHHSKRNFSGGFESLPTFEVPKMVLDAALKACKVVGNGLYGVDIKVLEDRPYVIEVNDNPSIDYKVEDAYIGDELYMQIMAEFLRRLEMRGR